MNNLNNLTTRKIERRARKITAILCCLLLALAATASPAFAVDVTTTDPLQIVENLSDFVFSLIRAVGLILLGFGILQLGLSLKTHSTNPHKTRHYPQKPSETHKPPS